MRLQRFLEDRLFQERYGRNIYAVRIIAVNRWLFEARPTLNLPCQDKVTPSMAARGYWKLRAIGCRGASWSEQVDGKELRRALESAIGTERNPVFWTSSARPSSSATAWCADFKGLCKSCCTAVMQKSTTSYSSVFLSRSVLSCIRISAHSFPCSRSECCLFSEGCRRELVHLR